MAVYILRKDVSLVSPREKSEGLVWRVGQPQPRSADWKCRAAVRHVGTHQRTPAEFGIDKKTAVIGYKKLRVGCDLPEAEGNLSIENILFQPKLCTPERIETGNVRNCQKIAD